MACFSPLAFVWALSVAPPFAPLSARAPPPPMGGPMCTGFGARLEARVESHSTYAERRALYATFCDTVLRGFKGARLIQTTFRVAGAFESEAEHWVERAWSRSSAFLFGGAGNNVSGAIGNESSASYSSAIGTLASSTSNATEGSRLSSSILAGALSCLSQLYQSIMKGFDALPPSFTAEPPAARANGLVLLSGGDRNAALSERVVANHGAFARRHGYAHWWHRGSLVAQHGYLPYWHKVAMLRQAFDRFPSARAYAWVDDDIVLTNHREGEDMIELALRRSNASVIVTRDPGSRTGFVLNTGIILVRNDDSGREVLDEVWRRASSPRDDGLSLAHDPQSRGCLHEQQALQEMIAHSAHWRARVAVLDQREQNDAGGEAVFWNLNTFLRWSHYDAERAEQLRYDADAAGSGWTHGDFAGHCSGLSPVRRALCVASLLGAVVS